MYQKAWRKEMGEWLTKWQTVRTVRKPSSPKFGEFDINGLGERAVQRNAHDSLNDSGKPQFRPVSHCKELGALLRVKPDIEEEASWLQMRAGGGGPGQSMYVTHHTATRPVTPLLHSITMFSTRLSATLWRIQLKMYIQLIYRWYVAFVQSRGVDTSVSRAYNDTRYLISSIVGID